MPREEQDQRIRIEHRGPVVLAVLGVVFVLTMLPSRIRLFPTWTPYAIGTGLLLPLVGTWLSGGRPRWLWLERVTMIAFSVLAEALTLITLFYLIHQMLNRPVEFSGRQLFMSSVAAWVTNVLTFSLLYWRIDCGGPEARMNNTVAKPDWLFPQASVPEAAPPGWRPTYVDYLSIAFTAATAFSPAEGLPLTRRAKLLMMVESSVSLTTLIVVASRAIGLLGG